MCELDENAHTKHFLQFRTSVRYCCDGAGGEARFSGTAQLAWNKETSASVPPTLGSQMGELGRTPQVHSYMEVI